MPLPELIEIVPLKAPVHAEITVPGSKSITNRALILAALAEGETVLKGALWSEDTQVMVDCLQRLGFAVQVRPDPHEFSNRTILVRGAGGAIPNAGTETAPLELFVGNAGTAARFLAALACLGRGVYRLHGVPRMHERPQAALFSALRRLGYRVDSPNDKLPAVIHGTGPRSATCTVHIGESSQFASALLLGAGRGQWHINIEGENAEESPYVTLTEELCSVFREPVKVYPVPPDASSGSYFWAAGYLMAHAADLNYCPVTVLHWPMSGFQIDANFPQFWPLPATVSRRHELGDSIMTAIVLAPFAEYPVHFTDLGRLRLQECDRVQALHDELHKCGGSIAMDAPGETLFLRPARLHGARIETYDDHRMAMCFAILGLKVPGLQLHNPACVRKTFPNFFQKLAAPPPEGLGATILDATRTPAVPLTHAELFAD